MKVNLESVRVVYRKHYFVNKTAKIWSNLPPHVVSRESCELFKDRLSDVKLGMYCKGRAVTAEDSKALYVLECFQAVLMDSNKGLLLLLSSK